MIGVESVEEGEPAIGDMPHPSRNAGDTARREAGDSSDPLVGDIGVKGETGDNGAAREVDVGCDRDAVTGERELRAVDGACGEDVMEVDRIDDPILAARSLAAGSGESVSKTESSAPDHAGRYTDTYTQTYMFNEWRKKNMKGPQINKLHATE
jgi:hypothetical protein